MRSIPARVVLLLVTLTPFSTLANADWPAEGKMIMVPTDGVHRTGPVSVFDLPSGQLMVLGTGDGGNANGYTLQLIDPDGVVAPGWPADGVDYGTVGKQIRPQAVGFTIDDAGDAWQMTYAGSSQNQEGAHLITPQGALLPSFGGWALSSQSIMPSGFAPAPGGLYAYFGGRVQRVLRSGAIAPGWPATGVAAGMGSAGTICVAQADGAGGVILFTTTYDPRIQRFDSTAVRHAGWPAAGIPLSTSATDGIPDLYDAPLLPSLIRSDGTHFIAAWSGPYDSPVKRVRLQRFSVDGVIDPTWPSDGVQAVAPDSINSMTVLPDRSGGVYVLWFAHDMPRGTHVHADGTFEPGTNDGGTSLLGPGAAFSLPVFWAVQSYVPADATPDGRLVFAWNDQALAPTRSIRVRWLLPDLTHDPSEPDEGRVIIPPQARLGYGIRAVHADELGGAYVAWDMVVESTTTGDYGEVWMTRLLPSPVVGTPPAPTPAPRLALSAPRPNPARGVIALDLTLPDDSPARVVLLDVAGRVQRARAVQGAGAHRVEFSDLGALPSGLYFARVSHPLGSATSRVVVSR